MKKLLSIIMAVSMVISIFSVQLVTNASAETSFDVLSNISYFKVNGRNIKKNQLDQAGSSLEFITLTASPNGEWKTVYFDKGAYSSDGSTAVNFVGSFTWANIGSCDGVTIRASQNTECFFDEFHTIRKGTAPTPTATTTVKTTSNPSVIKGDIDGNGVINISDLRVMLGAISANKPIDKARGDLDNNGNVDIMDMRILLAKIL